MSSNSFTIKWQPPEYDGGSPILEYIIEMRDQKKGEFKKIGSTKGDITDILVKYLEKDHGYFFKITARNTVGVSDPYETSDVIIAGSRLSKYILFV